MASCGYSQRFIHDDKTTTVTADTDTHVSQLAPSEREERACPVGCVPDDTPVITGPDRLHGMPGTFQVVRCEHCGLMRTNPRPTPDAMGWFYPEDYAPYAQTLVATKPKGVSAPRKKKRRKKRLTPWYAPWVIKRPRTLPMDAPGRLVEIGCASGSFLHACERDGWTVSGIEFSPHAAQQAQAHGLDVQCSTIEAASDPDAPIDVVAAWMVLEHLHEPVAALQKLHRWTRPDGWLVLSVPDASAWEFKLFGNRWFALQLPTHLYHYAPRTLRVVLDRAGWSVERVFWYRNPNNLLISLSYWAADRGMPRFERWLRDVAADRRGKRVKRTLGWWLALFRQSGRLTVWARRV